MSLRNLLLLAVPLLATACWGPALASDEDLAPDDGPAVTVKGSDTMVLLGQRWAENYMIAHPERTVQVTGGGSGTGVAALINGTTDIANASRPMKDVEKAQVESKRGESPVEIPVALDGIAIYVSGSNALREISLQQLKQIYTGELTHWRELGGPDKRIVLYSRENSSGTYAYFKEHVLEEEDFAAEAQTLPGTAAVINAVSRDPYAIGYGGIAYDSGIITVAVKKDEASPAIAPTEENVVSGAYPISRSLFMYTAGVPRDDVQAFIDYALSPEGQQVAAKVGYYPLPRTQPR